MAAGSSNNHYAKLYPPGGTWADEFLHLFISRSCFRDDVVDERPYSSPRTPKLSSIKKRVFDKGVVGCVYSLTAWIPLNQGMIEGDQIRSRRSEATGSGGRVCVGG